jgi:hypothetical protein
MRLTPFRGVSLKWEKGAIQDENNMLVDTDVALPRL